MSSLAPSLRSLLQPSAGTTDSRRLGLLPLEVFTGHLPTDQTGEAQDGLIDTALPSSGFTCRPEGLDRNLFVLEGHAFAPNHNRLTPIKTEASPTEKRSRARMWSLGSYGVEMGS